MRYVTSGESHGRALTAIVSDVPAGIPLSQESIDADLSRRQVGYGRGGRMRIESDVGRIISGVRFGRTIGSPVTIVVTNRDWDNWTDVMAVAGDRPGGSRVTAPRPGHADLPGLLKIGSDDVRDVLERASARETAARTAAGVVAKSLLGEVGVSLHSFVSAIGPVAMPPVEDPADVDRAAVEASDVRCPDPATAEAIREAIDRAREAGESLGGWFYVVARGLLPGIGGYAQPDQRLDAALAGAVMSIPAIKGVEIGAGFEGARRPGSGAHDEIRYAEERGYFRSTNHAGGIEGGMSNGEPLVLRAAMKPIPTLMSALASVDIDTKAAIDASKERSDVCAVPAAAVVAEAETAIVLAHAYMRKFGSDCLADICAGIDAYRERLLP